MLNALWIVILGMAIVFAVLGILLLITKILNKLVQPKHKVRNSS
jgi:Na+-transporting methylmalonyl-CoA/oxaloacetate decarboxylase gamma subunit